MKSSIFIFALLVFSMNASYGNSVAGSVANGIVNHDGIAWDNRVPDQGREYALDAAQRDSNTGAIMAGITGAALASTATGFFLAGDFATGSALMGMAGMEFAQMAASGRDSGINRSQRDVLLQKTDTGSAFDLNREKERLRSELPESFDDFLNERGVNPDQFKNLLFDGKIQDQQSVMDALGIESGSLSSAELKLGSEKADSKLNDILKSAQASFDSRQGGGRVASNSEKSDHKLPDQFGNKEKSVDEPKSKRSRGSLSAKGKAKSEFVPPSMVANYYGIPESNLTPQELSLLTDGFLRDQGILPSRTGRHIFQLANDSYKIFSKTLIPTYEKN